MLPRKRHLPAGNSSGLLASRTWQPFPGMPEAEIFPEIRKADVISSNSYLVRTGDCLILIDPGGLASQAELLAAEIAPCLAVGVPLVVLLTHAHCRPLYRTAGTSPVSRYRARNHCGT